MSVTPAQAGIQQTTNSREADKIELHFLSPQIIYQLENSM
jgi:hypothetical protein